MTKKPDALTVEIADRLQRIRERKYSNQKEFARVSGISLSYVRKMEEAGSSPTVGMLNTYLGALNYSLSRFFARYTRAGDHVAANKEIQKRVLRILADDTKKAHLLQYLDYLDPNS
jgi:transcriptional regulator with XRE-family HTH domain